MRYRMETYGEWKVVKGEPRGIRLWYWKWWIALRLARTIVRRSIYIVKPLSTADGTWTIATKISLWSKEYSDQSRDQEANGRASDQNQQ